MREKLRMCMVWQKRTKNIFFFGLFTIYYFCYTLSLNVSSLCRNKPRRRWMLFDVQSCPWCLCMRYQLAFGCVSHSLLYSFFALRIFSNDISSLRFNFFALAKRDIYLLNVLKSNCNFICFRFFVSFVEWKWKYNWMIWCGTKNFVG